MEFEERRFAAVSGGEEMGWVDAHCCCLCCWCGMDMGGIGIDNILLSIMESSWSSSSRVIGKVPSVHPPDAKIRSPLEICSDDEQISTNSTVRRRYAKSEDMLATYVPTGLTDGRAGGGPQGQ